MTSPLILVAAGFLVALLCAPAGVSGAFLLVPLQVSVLGLATSSATGSTLLFNVVSTPGGIARYRHEGKLDGRLVRLVLIGSLPGVVVGALLRASVFRSPGSFKAFVGIVLIGLAGKLLLDARAGIQPRRPARPASAKKVIAASFAVGIVGGIYGIGGGSILAPYLMAVAGLSAYRVAGTALVATLVTSVAGVLVLCLLGMGPDWRVGLLLGLGGLAGSYAGASLQRRVSETGLRVLVATLSGAVGIGYLVSSVAALRG